MRAAALALVFSLLSCGAVTKSADPADLCACTATESAADDYRHDAKHVPLPNLPAQEITVADMLGWTQGPALPADAPREGRELQMFHIARAFLHVVFVNQGDCDIHAELANSADRNAPRVIVETPVDEEYCSTRRSLQQQLASRGINVTNQNGVDLAQPVPVDVVGLAFQDFEHQRGSPQVATTWELHPAMITVLPS